MKKFAFIFAAIAASIVVSCTKETPAETPDTSAPAEMKLVTITASVDDTATKTTYTQDGTDPTLLKFSWTKGDQISVYCSDNNFYTFTAEDDGTSVSFTGSIPEKVSLGWCAFYPADAGHKVVKEGDVEYYYYNYPEYKDLSTTGSADLPMGAVKNEGVYAFKHMSGAAWLTFTNIPDFVKEVEISIVNSAHIISGSFKTYSNDTWSWVYAGANTVSEKTLIRKVAVTNNQAQLYFPFKGQMWSTNIINITGFDSEGNEYALLADKTMKGRSEEFVPGTIIPYAPLELPDYVPSVDWTKVDWSAENVNVYDLPAKASASRQALRQLKVVADSYYMYVRLVASAEKLTSTNSSNLGLFLYDVVDGTGNGYYDWNNGAAGNTEYEGEHAGTLNLTDYSIALSVNETAVDVNTVVSADEVVWTLAIPRSAHPNLASTGNVHVTFLTYAGWEPTGSVPEKYDPMMIVSLP